MNCVEVKEYFHVGDIITGTDLGNERYAYTDSKATMKVLFIDNINISRIMRVRILSGPRMVGSEFTVDNSDELFELVRR